MKNKRVWTMVVLLNIFLITYFLKSQDNTKSNASELLKVTFIYCLGYDERTVEYTIEDRKLLFRGIPKKLTKNQIHKIYDYPKQIAVKDGIYGFKREVDGSESHIIFEFNEHNTTYTIDTNFEKGYYSEYMSSKLESYLMFLDQLYLSYYKEELSK